MLVGLWKHLLSLSPFLSQAPLLFPLCSSLNHLSIFFPLSFFLFSLFLTDLIMLSFLPLLLFPWAVCSFPHPSSLFLPLLSLPLFPPGPLLLPLAFSSPPVPSHSGLFFLFSFLLCSGLSACPSHLHLSVCLSLSHTHIHKHTHFLENMAE